MKLVIAFDVPDHFKAFIVNDPDNTVMGLTHLKKLLKGVPISFDEIYLERDLTEDDFIIAELRGVEN